MNAPIFEMPWSILKRNFHLMITQLLILYGYEVPRQPENKIPDDIYEEEKVSEAAIDDRIPAF